MWFTIAENCASRLQAEVKMLRGHITEFEEAYTSGSISND